MDHKIIKTPDEMIDRDWTPWLKEKSETSIESIIEVIRIIKGLNLSNDCNENLLAHLENSLSNTLRILYFSKDKLSDFHLDIIDEIMENGIKAFKSND